MMKLICNSFAMIQYELNMLKHSVKCEVTIH